MNLDQDHLDPQVRDLFDALRPVPERNPVRATRTRGEYLKQIRTQKSSVSDNPLIRLKNNMDNMMMLIFRKEKFAMNMMLAFAVAVAAIFGGTSISAYASQDSLPDQPLYAVKLLGEDLRLQMTGDLEARAEMETNFVQTRFQEMAAMHGQGEDIPLELTQRMETQTDEVLALASRMGEDGIQTAMARLSKTLSAGDAMIHEQGAGEEAANARLQQFIAERQDLARLGEQDPVQFAARYRETIGQFAETPEPDTPLLDRDRLMDMLRDRLRLRQTPVATDAPETPAGEETPAGDETPAPEETLDPGTTPEVDGTPQPDATSQPPCTPQQDRLQERDQDRDQDRDGSGGNGKNDDSGNGNGGSGGNRSTSGGGKKR